MEIFKFGGLSTQDADSVKRVSEIIKANSDKELVLVFSAMGKTTRQLEKFIYSAFHNKPDFNEQYQLFYDYHFKIINELNLNDNEKIAIGNIFNEVKKYCNETEKNNYDFFYDQIVCYGELIASRILSFYLEKIGLPNKWIDIRNSLITNNHFREGVVNWEDSNFLIRNNFLFEKNQNNLFVTQGFIAKTKEGFTTTLGLDGSDYTAAILAHCLDANHVTIWKDVKGVMNADPKYFDETIMLNTLSYNDAIELAFYGANVIHPKAIKPLQNKNISLEVKSFFTPKHKGTIINNEPCEQKITTYIFKINQVLLTISPLDFSFIIEENLRDIFDIFSKYYVKVNIMQNTAISFTVSIDNNETKLPDILKELNQRFKVESVQGLELITIRNHNQQIIDKVIANKKVFVKFLSGNVAQIIAK
ncbi:MAG: aspartate kinase [Bacteroidetes bacterium]|nr:aspartate kinase [Bacteroidota bacterium]